MASAISVFEDAGASMMETLFEKALRKSLTQAHAAQILQPHAGKVLRVEIATMTIALRIGEDGLPVAVHRAIKADACVSLPVSRLFGATSESMQSSGDSELLAAFAKAMDQAEFEPEAIAERSFGPLAGSATANAVACLREWAADARVRLGDNVAEWLTKESEILPEPQEGKRMAQEIDKFAAKVEMLRQSVIAREAS